MTGDHYILQPDGTIVKTDLLTWAKWLDCDDRHIGQDALPNGAKISTVFLGLDHNFADDGPPLLFETMIFGGEHDQYQERYATMEEAKEGHRKAVELAGQAERGQ